jgi:hypothetical protein
LKKTQENAMMCFAGPDMMLPNERWKETKAGCEKNSSLALLVARLSLLLTLSSM